MPLLSTVVLNWNRAYLLEKTIASYLATVSVGYELTVVDNASTDGSRELIRETCTGRANVRAILLDSNLGGEALNIGLAEARGRYLHVSENDLEYLPGWDTEMLAKFEAFPELGQLSPFSPFPQVERGEVWVEKPATLVTQGHASIYVALGNVTTSCIIRRQIWDQGVRWKTFVFEVFRFPNDGAFSSEVKDLGYLVAWNDKYVAVNWGCNIEEFSGNVAYYVQNYKDKPWLGVQGWAERLAAHGFRLVQDEGGDFRIVSASGEDRRLRDG